MAEDIETSAQSSVPIGTKARQLSAEQDPMHLLVWDVERHSQGHALTLIPVPVPWIAVAFLSGMDMTRSTHWVGVG
ncbi:hypothetical protein ARTHRO8AJ_460063 [Arthrobacter sp. 8AJ]|nr:hypothetical protein ARTHRO8AJ_460063 [Arthrobacter sp. 8AJ]